MSSLKTPGARISPFLWFDGRAEEAARHYTAVFPDSRIVHISRYSEVGREQHGQVPGSVMVVAFELDGQPFAGINGGPQFSFSEAVSFVVHCDSQAEIDHYWSRLSEGGPAEAQMCGWLKDRFGLSWQVIPRVLPQMMMDPDPRKPERVMAAVMQMRKIELAAVERAYAGQ